MENHQQYLAPTKKYESHGLLSSQTGQHFNPHQANCCHHQQQSAQQQPSMHWTKRHFTQNASIPQNTPESSSYTSQPTTGMYGDVSMSGMNQDASTWLQSVSSDFSNTGYATNGVDPRQLVDHDRIQPKYEASQAMYNEMNNFGQEHTQMLEDFENLDARYEQSHLSPYFQTGHVHTGLERSMSPANSSYDMQDLNSTYLEEGTESAEPYNKLLHKCLMEAPDHELQLKDIYDWFRRNTGKGHSPNEKGWQNSIRHNLSMNPAFQKGSRVDPDSSTKNIWSLTTSAVNGQIEPTTRFRNQHRANQQLNRNARYSHPPALQRQRSGAKGGQQAARRSARIKRNQQLSGTSYDSAHGETWCDGGLNANMTSSNRSTPAFSPSPAPFWHSTSAAADIAVSQAHLQQQQHQYNNPYQTTYEPTQPYYAIPDQQDPNNSTGMASTLFSPSLEQYLSTTTTSGPDTYSQLPITNTSINPATSTAVETTDSETPFTAYLTTNPTHDPLLQTTTSSPSPLASLGPPPSLINDLGPDTLQPLTIDGVHPDAHSDARVFFDEEDEDAAGPVTPQMRHVASGHDWTKG